MINSKNKLINLLGKIGMSGSGKFLFKFKYVFICLFIAVFAVVIILIVQKNSSKITIGFIADIHAGDQKIRTDREEETNEIASINFEKNVTSALGNMNDADLIFSMGDSLNRPSKKNTKKLLEITENYPLLWVKGNHDEDSDFNEFLSHDNYYLKDMGHWRILVIDNSATFPDKTGKSEEARGYINAEQLDWIKKSLKTKKDVLIMMHIPIFDRYDLGKVRPEQQYLEDMFIASENVKHVFSGHFHIQDRQTERSGITYHLIPSVSLLSEGGKYHKIILKK